MRPQRSFLALAAMALAAGMTLALACSSNDDATPAGPEPPVAETSPLTETATPTPGEAADPPAAPAPTQTATPLPEPESGLPEVGVETALGGLQFERMTGTYQDGDGNWYVTSQGGVVMRVAAGSTQAVPWLDISGRVDDSANEMGLLGFALAPDFLESGRFYVSYTSSNESVISRFTATPGFESADPDSEQRVLMLAQPFRNHNGGQILFGPEGYLYAGFGDGGAVNDPQNNGQDLGTLLGAILRIDVAGGGEGYDIPPENPFAGRNDARGEIWAYGLRNPWRLSFDRDTGDLWAGDVGQNFREEVNIIVAGGNYGWRVMEGFECRGGGSNCDMEGLLLPVLDYSTRAAGNCSVTGGFVYRGGAIPELRGAYVYSDYCSGNVYALRHRDGVLTEDSQIAATGVHISSLAEDNDGELYLLQHADAGVVFKLVP